MTSIIHTAGLVMTKSEPRQKKAVDRPGPTRAQVVVSVSYRLEKEISPKKRKTLLTHIPRVDLMCVAAAADLRCTTPVPQTHRPRSPWPRPDPISYVISLLAH
jgi:hypothetical protein